MREKHFFKQNTMINMTEFKDPIIPSITQSSTDQILQQCSKLLQIVRSNESSQIESFFGEQPSEEVIRHKFHDHGNKTIPVLACIESKITADTLNTLCDCLKRYFPDVDFMDECWYKWEPLHYVAREGDPEKLQVIVDNFSGIFQDQDGWINSLTTFSENALHVLLAYEKSVSPYSILLYSAVDSTQSKPCTVISLEKDKVVKCAKILIDQGIDVNHRNFSGESPICLAARNRYKKVIDLLLERPDIDLDDSKESGKTVREYLKQNHIRSDLPQSNVCYGNPVKMLFDFLKTGNENAFLNFNNIFEFFNQCDGGSEYYTCGNMLQLCFKKGFLEYLESEAYNKTVSSTDIMDTPMLEVFNKKGLGKSIEHLLDNKADPSLTYRKFKETLLEAAAVRGYYPLVNILLNHKYSKITSYDIFKVLPKLYKVKYDLKNYEVYRMHVLCLLLDKLFKIYKFQRYSKLKSDKLDILYSVLGDLNLEADEMKSDDSENICLILKLGACLSGKCPDGRLVLDRMHSNILQKHFDQCVLGNVFIYNSIILDENGKYSETKTLDILSTDSSKQELLNHPIFIQFNHNKWLRIKWFFYLDLIIYTLFLLSLYSYMILINISFIGNHKTVFMWFFYIFVAIHFVKELFQLLFLHRLKYFRHTTNYYELIVLISCLAVIIYPNVYIMVLAILLSTVIFFLMLGQLPVFTKYTIIFGSTKYFIKYAAFYFFQFISFAICFYIIFPFESDETTKQNDDNIVLDTLGDILKSLFYTLILFTGEFNDRVLESKKYPIFGRIIMTIFIFCMTIILNNLLVGLIVADINEMQRIGKTYRHIKTARFIVKTNSFVKRLQELKSFTVINDIINYLQIFKKGQSKTLVLNECLNSDYFDEEDKECLKKLKNRTKEEKQKENRSRKLYVHA